MLGLAGKIIEEFKSSGDYQLYMRAKSKVEDNTELKVKIAEFKRAEILFESKQMQDNQINIEEEKKVSKLYSDILIDEDGRLFLETEKNLFAQINEIFEFIGENCGIDFEL